LHRLSGLPLVLDYRDEWGLTNECQENKEFGAVGRWLNGKLERAVVRRASAVVATTMSSADGLSRIVRDAGSHARVACIPNGFDPDDFTGEDPREPGRACYRLVYAGTLWNLTSVAPLVDAIALLCSRSPALAARLELVFVGRKTADQERHLSRLADQPARVVEHRYVDHPAAVQTMRSADLLCALLTDRPGADRVLPGKIFEYMACGRPVLAIAPRGDLWQVLDDYPSSRRSSAGRARRRLSGRVAATTDGTRRTHLRTCCPR
jgi:glycosyltransferase involved in cell wall biosynthesis